MTIVVLHASCKYRWVYTCMTCEDIKVGGTVRVTFSGATPRQLEDFLTSQPAKASAMPVGWASYSNGFQCDKCGVEDRQA